MPSLAWKLLLTLECFSVTSASSENIAQTALAFPFAPATTHLNVTAIVSLPEEPHHAAIRCLQSPEPFVTYPTIGSSLLLGNTANLTLVTLPASPHGEGEGWHNPPYPMWFVLLSGRARVWTPPIDSNEDIAETDDASGQEVLINGEGDHRNQIVLALDTLGRGHKTWYYGPSGSFVSALQIPLGDNVEEALASWRLLHEGPC
jgi:hypothetical protein